MTRVSAELTPEEWGSLDRWAEYHGVTRSQAVREACVRLTNDFESYIGGATQQGLLHPALTREGRA